MREIKFQVRTSERIEVEPQAFIEKREWITYTPETFPIMWKDKLDIKTRRMYTGLKDKNGVEIYEGDIVKVPDDWDGFGWWAGHVGSVVYEDGYFGLSNPDMKHPGYLHEVVSEIEVIGNIYENPELLEAEL